MQLVFSDQPLPSKMTKSLFLAGPSPRALDQLDWRRAAVQLLQDLGFDGTLFLPVPSTVFNGTGETHFNYDNQVNWEKAARKQADCLVFWVPRVIDRSRGDLGMPAFTTNFELGEDLASGKVEYGRPNTAVKCSYLDHCALEKGLPVHEDLETTLKQALQVLGDGAPRADGEVQVPLFIWRTPQFQAWYGNLKAAGNVLKRAEVLHNFQPRRGVVFSFVLHVHIWVRAEDRIKSNEIIISRPDICVVVAHGRVDGVAKIVLVKEFRSPGNNPQGYVYELPGGSSPKPTDEPHVVAQQELHEEVGLMIADASRFQFVGVRQLVATFSTHRAWLFKVMLTEGELRQLEATSALNAPLGHPGDSEQTFVQVVTASELRKLPVDYSTLGMVFEALQG